MFEFRVVPCYLNLKIAVEESFENLIFITDWGL